MILTPKMLRERKPVKPFVERAVSNGMTYGLGPAGYDVRIAEKVLLKPGAFALASTIERFTMNPDVIGFVHDKSTWARKGLTVQNTVIEPGWQGWLTLELTNHGYSELLIEAGSPIAQVIFHLLPEETDLPYGGKYQNQQRGPQPAILEEDKG
jgi:dCTP deaminase